MPTTEMVEKVPEKLKRPKVIKFLRISLAQNAEWKPPTSSGAVWQ